MGEPEELIQARLAKLKSWEKKRGSPYELSFEPSLSLLEAQERFKDLKPGELSNFRARLAGRLMSRREHGKATFGHIKEGTGTIQLFLSVRALSSQDYQDFLDLIDIGDIVGVEGEILKTRRGELSIEVEKFYLLAKCLRPLPEKWHGLQDVETRFRQRYLDLLMNPQVREVFETRSKVIKAVKSFLNLRGFLGVETPILQPLPGGAAARPFITHHNALDIDLYLRIAPELYLKRLVVGGLGKVYEIGKNFRNEGISVKHNPEFTMLEVYEAYSNYRGMKKLLEEMLQDVVREVKGTLKVNYQGNEVDFSSFKEATLLQLIEEHIGLPVSFDMSKKELKEVAEKHGVEVKEYFGKGKIVVELFEKVVEPQIHQPTFVFDYPKEISPLARTHPQNPNLTERFELIVVGREIANAFSELNDPIEQRKRFEEQLVLRELGDEEAQRLDEDFLQALEYGLPPTGGLGVGIDRLVMLLTDSYSIREVLFFPQLRPEKT
jgi:lysyl-tRNA synthetase class 2